MNAQKVFTYVLGIPCVFLWLFVAITGMTWILWAMVVVGVSLMSGAVYVVYRDSKASHGPWQQYVARHNAKAVIEKRKEALAEQALIDQSDD